jgi:hypothetical protein
MKFEILTITGEENRVLVESESEAVLANGNRYKNQYVFAFYFDNTGKILEYSRILGPVVCLRDHV